MPVKVYLGNKVSKISKSISKQLRERMAEAHSAQSYSRDPPAHLFGLAHVGHGCGTGAGCEQHHVWTKGHVRNGKALMTATG